MQRYANRSGDSGVTRYQAGADYIDIEFNGGAVYRYDYANTGEAEVEAMKILARAGRGLSTFISRNVAGAYASRRR